MLVLKELILTVSRPEEESLVKMISNSPWMTEAAGITNSIVDQRQRAMKSADEDIRPWSLYKTLNII